MKIKLSATVFLLLINLNCIFEAPNGKEYETYDADDFRNTSSEKTPESLADKIKKSSQFRLQYIEKLANNFHKTIENISNSYSSQNIKSIYDLGFKNIPLLFNKNVLDKVKIIVTPNLPVASAETLNLSTEVFMALYPGTSRQKIEEIQAVTYENHIYIHPKYYNSESEALLIHELVHVLQYKHLGTKGFAKQYLRDYFSPQDIKLEENAEEVEELFKNNGLKGVDSHHIKNMVKQASR